MRRVPGLALLGAAVAVLPGLEWSGALAERRALVIGIDDYEDEALLSDLRGAVNDARDLVNTFEALGFEQVVTLENREAQRGAILEAWSDLLAASGPGDDLYVTYAGHGMRVPARNAASEEDGMDELWALSGFSDRGPGRGQMILDDEIAGYIAEAEGRGVRVLLVVDACHSGTTFRNVDRRVPGLRYRAGGVLLTEGLFDGVDLSELAEPDPEIAPNLVSFAAALDSQKVPELLFPDENGVARERGALSYFFSRGALGAADADGDRAVSVAEMRDYLEVNIRHSTYNAQTPLIVAGSDALLIEAAADQDAEGVQPPAIAERSLRLAVRPLDADLPVLEGVERAWPDEQVDLVYDADARQVISGIDAVVAEDVAPARLQGVIDRHRAARRLAALAERRALTIGFAPERPIHRARQELAIRADGVGASYRVVFAIAGNGTVSLLWPLSEPEAAPVPAGAALEIGGIEVGPPFGADLVVAVAADAPLSELATQLAALDAEGVEQGRATALQAVNAVETALERQELRLGTAALFTCGDATC